jgi:single-strand DNA-binding protein
MNINAVVLVGNLGHDPELRHFEDGTAQATFSIACNDRKKQGESWVDVVHWFDVVVYGSQAEACGEYLAKGSKVGVSGKLQQRRWEKDGQKRSKIEIKARDVQFLSGGRNGDSSDAERAHDAAEDFSGGDF